MERFDVKLEGLHAEGGVIKDVVDLVHEQPVLDDGGLEKMLD